MKKEEISLELKEKAKKININLNNEQVENFYKYMELLLEWNEKINLTAITEPKEIILKHFIDSLTIYKYIVEKENVIDVGTGAGFPAIPLNIVNSRAEYTLLDSLNKRINFLNDVVNKLKLQNINAIHSRVEDFAKNNREKFDIATSRAVAPLNVLAEYLLPLVKVGGACICMKGANVSQETLEAKNAIKLLGGEIERIEEIKLPNSDITRNIVIIKKISHTPVKYPRKPGLASKDPIV